VISKGK